MSRSRRMTAPLALAAVSALLLAGCSSSASEADTSESGATTITVGIGTWIGYGALWVAEEQGYFEEAGLDVEFETFNTDRDKASAFVSGQLDVTTVASQTLLQLAEEGVDMTAFYVLDTSLQADSVLAGPDITSFADLKGKKLAWEEGSPSDLLIHWALREYGMTDADVEKIPMDANSVGTALIAGQVDGAGTYEPYITEVKTKNAGIHAVVTAAEAEGIISDVLLVKNEWAEKNADTLTALVSAIGKAADYYASEPEAAQQIIADALETPLEELATSFAGVEIYSLEANKELLSGSFITSGLPIVEQASIDAGLIKGGSDLASLVNSTFVNAAK